MPAHPAASPSKEIIDAVIDVLRADAGLTALLDASRVYLNAVPPTEHPLRYLLLTDGGEAFTDYFALDSTSETVITINIFALNVKAGDAADARVRMIYAALVPVLHNTFLTLAGGFTMLAPGLLSRSTIISDPPSGGTHGVCRYVITARKT